MDMAERQAMTLQFLRPAQVGPDGSANTSRVEVEGRLVRFPGGLALADVVNLMPRIVLYHTAHEPRALPPHVAFRTAAGGGIRRGEYVARGATTLITDRAVIRFGSDGPWLESFHPNESIESVVAATGFPLSTEKAVPTAPPSEMELNALAEIDPSRLRASEFKRRKGGHA
jgi:glutaconate CoA-transferase subunit B